MTLEHSDQVADFQRFRETSELDAEPTAPSQARPAKPPAAPQLLLPDGEAVPDALLRDTDRERRHGGDKRSGLLRRHPFAAPIAGALLALVAGGGYLYWDNAQHFETTDDAFIAARQFAIAPEVSGYITSVPVTDNQHVAAGQVIARIDDRNYLTALEQAQAQVASAQASIQNIDAQIAVQQAQVVQNRVADRAGAGQPDIRRNSRRRATGTLARTGAGTVQNAQQWLRSASSSRRA